MSASNSAVGYVEAALSRARAEGRREGLEEAAKVADDHVRASYSGGPSEIKAVRICASSIAGIIRAQKEGKDG